MIKTRDLTRTFHRGKEPFHAVKGIDLEVADGELVAFLGPNGAGKSTTLRMLTSLLRPTSGLAPISGHDVVAAPSKVRSNIGFIGQGNGAGYSYRVRDELHNQGRFYGLAARDYASRATELMEALGLSDLGKRTVESLSGGQRRRLDIALGLMNRPPLLFLDEPSTGLDPQARANLWEHIMSMRNRFDMTLVLTTHYLDEADSMAERVIVIDHGEVVADAPPATLKTDHADDVITVTLRDTDAAGRASANDVVARLRQVLPTQMVGADVAPGPEPRTFTAAVKTSRGPHRVPELLDRCGQADFTVLAADVHRASLDDVFLNLTGRSLREEAA